MESPLGTASKLSGAVLRYPLTFRLPRHGCMWSPHRRSRSHSPEEDLKHQTTNWKSRREQESVHRTNWLAVQDSTSWALLRMLVHQDTACEC